MNRQSTNNQWECNDKSPNTANYRGTSQSEENKICRHMRCYAVGCAYVLDCALLCRPGVAFAACVGIIWKGKAVQSNFGTIIRSSPASDRTAIWPGDGQACTDTSWYKTVAGGGGSGGGIDLPPSAVTGKDICRIGPARAPLVNPVRGRQWPARACKSQCE